MTEVQTIVDPDALGKPCAIRAFQDVGHTLAMCRRLRQIGVIVGTTGAGKTTAAKAHAEAHPTTTVYMRLPVFAATLQPFLVRLSRAAGLPPTSLTGKAELAEDLIGFLRSKPGILVIIDEANHMTPDLVQGVRELWDEARCGFALVGTPDMEVLWAERSGRRAGANDPMAAFRARIGQRLPMPKPDADDVTVLCRHMGLTGKREHDLIARCLKGGIGLHSVEQLLSNARLLAGDDQAVTVENLFDAYSMMKG